MLFSYHFKLLTIRPENKVDINTNESVSTACRTPMAVIPMERKRAAIDSIFHIFSDLLIHTVASLSVQ